MSGYELTVILEEDGIKVGRIQMDPGEFRVVAESAGLSGAPTAAVRRLNVVSAAYYTAGDQYRAAGVCFTLSDSGKQLSQPAMARRVLDAVKEALA